jgi:hypothetical protein
MKTTILSIKFSLVILLSLFVISCEKELIEDSKKEKIEPLSAETECARFERENGITLFKKDFIYDDGENKAVLRIATKSELIFKNIIENYEIIIKPIYKQDKHVKQNNQKGQLQPSKNKIVGDEILTEYISMKRNNNVVGFSTSFKLINFNTLHKRYAFHVTHYSNNWPSTFYINLIGIPGWTGKVAFECRRKWYNGWESDTNCIIGSGSGEGVGYCFQAVDLPVEDWFIFDVDGPWRSRVYIDTESPFFEWEFTY